MRRMPLLCLVLALAHPACATTTSRRGLPPLQAVTTVDLGRYLGVWHEVARFPERYEEGCFGSTATYSLRPDGDIDVANACRKGSADGELKVAHGRARRLDPARPGELQVSFFWPFWADYWVIDLDPEYRHALVGHPSRDQLWILARTPSLEPATYAALVAQARAMGYETERLTLTP